MGLGIGHGLNDEPTLGQKWRTEIAKQTKSAEQLLQEASQTWFDQTIKDIPRLVEQAFMQGFQKIELPAPPVGMKWESATGTPVHALYRYCGSNDLELLYDPESRKVFIQPKPGRS